MDSFISHFSDGPVLVAGNRAPWLQACMSDAMSCERLGDILAKADSGDDFWPDESDWMSRYRPYIVRDGVLTIPVTGMLFNGAGMTASYMTSYEYIVRAMERGAEDSSVHGMVLAVNSYGGTVAGAFDAGDKMHALTGKKPVKAVLNEHAYSAAYLVASVADKISIPRTGGAGSIGAVAMHVDFSGFLKKEGIKVTFVTAGEFKADGNPYETLSETAKAEMQARVDLARDIFVASVARNRNMPADALYATEARCYLAAPAVAEGLADEIAAADQSYFAFAAAVKPTTGSIMTEKTYTQAELDAACTTATSQGADRERVRVAAILGSEQAKARPNAAMTLATTTNMSAESALSILGGLPEEQSAKPADKDEDKTKAKGHFDAAMEKGNPNLTPGDGGEKDDNDPKARAASMMASYGAASGFKPKQAAA